MKTRIATAIIAALALTACTTVTTTAPDGTVTTVKSADPATVQAIANGYNAYIGSKAYPVIKGDK